MRQATYDEIRPVLRSGDIIAFGGNSPFSVAIKFITCCKVSHVATVLRVTSSYEDRKRVQIIEATSLGKGDAGVKVHTLGMHVESYKGNIWVLPLAKSIRSTVNMYAYMYFLASQEGKPYDLPQAIAAALDGFISDTETDYSKFLCSELSAGGLKKGFEHLPDSYFKNINPSEEVPKDVVLYPIYEEPIQIKGKPTELL